MRLLCVGEKLEFAKAAKDKNLKEAIKSFKKMIEIGIADDVLFISTSYKFEEFDDYLFDNLSMVPISHRVVENYSRAADSEKRCLAIYEYTKNESWNDSKFISDVATISIAQDNLKLLKVCSEQGYKELDTYCVDPSHRWTLTEMAGHYKGYYCLAYLIESGHLAHNFKHFECMVWAYPWGESVLLESEYWDAVFKDLGSIYTITPIELEALFMWADRACHSDQNVEMFLCEYLKSASRAIESPNKIDYLSYINTSELATRYLKELRNRDVKSFNDYQLIIMDNIKSLETLA
jgi:hypothetical protein